MCGILGLDTVGAHFVAATATTAAAEGGNAAAAISGGAGTLAPDISAGESGNEFAGIGIGQAGRIARFC